MNGKKLDILIEDKTITDNRTGVETVSDRTFVVWADAETKDIISKVDGVVAVYTNQPYATKYDVFIDARYDIQYVKEAVKAAILCRDE